MNDPEEISPILPEACGLMVLPNAALFPYHRMPLYIFEDRYRKMLADTLDGDRMFAIAMPKEKAGEEPDNFESIGGLGLVRACVQQEDGTSQLVLQGLSRVRFAGEVMLKPYRHCAIEPFESHILEPATASHWLGRLRESGQQLARRQPETFNALGEICQLELEPEMQSDLISGALPMAQNLSIRLLSESVVERRLEFLTRIIEAILSNLEQGSN